MKKILAVFAILTLMNVGHKVSANPGVESRIIEVNGYGKTDAEASKLLYSLAFRLCNESRGNIGNLNSYSFDSQTGYAVATYTCHIW